MYGFGLGKSPVWSSHTAAGILYGGLGAGVGGNGVGGTIGPPLVPNVTFILPTLPK